MSDTLGPGGPNSEDRAAGPEYLDVSSGAPLSEADDAVSTRSRRRRGLLIAGAMVGVGVAGAGAWATTAFFANGAQPAEALPASTLAYVSVDMSPSGEQILEAYQFAKKFPAFEEEFDLDENADPREQLFTWLQDQGTCEDIDYAKDVEPWLGTSAGLAAIDLGDAGGKDEVTPAAVLAIEDAELAESGLKKLQTCDGSDSDDTGGWAIAGDWAILAEDDKTAEAVVAATEEEALTDSSEHSQWLDEIGDLGVMTMYVSPEAPRKAMDYVEKNEEDPATTELLDEYRDLYENFSGMAATVRFGDEGVELVAAADATLNGVEVSGTEAGQSVTSLPQDTLAAVGVSVGDDYAETLLDQLTVLAEAGGTEDANQIITDFEEQSGLDLPEDLQTLLGESVVLSLSEDLDVDQLANSSDGSDIPVGAKITGDADGIEEVLDKLRNTIGADAETVLDSDASGDVVAVGPNDDYRSELLDEGSLGDSETFADVVGDVDSSAGVIFVDLDGADNWLDQLAEDSGDEEVAKNLKPLSAVGMNTTLDGDVATVTIRVSTE
jgi:Protein of unknown function (DUF3352)